MTPNSPEVEASELADMAIELRDRLFKLAKNTELPETLKDYLAACARKQRVVAEDVDSIADHLSE